MTAAIRWSVKLDIGGAEQIYAYSSILLVLNSCDSFKLNPLGNITFSSFVFVVCEAGKIKWIRFSLSLNVFRIEGKSYFLLLFVFFEHMFDSLNSITFVFSILNLPSRQGMQRGCPHHNHNHSNIYHQPQQQLSSAKHVIIIVIDIVILIIMYHGNINILIIIFIATIITIIISITAIIIISFIEYTSPLVHSRLFAVMVSGFIFIITAMPHHHHRPGRWERQPPTLTAQPSPAARLSLTTIAPQRHNTPVLWFPSAAC